MRVLEDQVVEIREPSPRSKLRFHDEWNSQSEGDFVTVTVLSDASQVTHRAIDVGDLKAERGYRFRRRRR